MNFTEYKHRHEPTIDWLQFHGSWEPASMDFHADAMRKIDLFIKCKWTQLKREPRIVALESKDLGIYLAITPNKITVQLRGFFWIQFGATALKIAQRIYSDFGRQVTKEPLHITKIDIAIDLAGVEPSDVLPKHDIENGVAWSFHKIQQYSHIDIDTHRTTGIQYKSSKFWIRIYDKTLEIKIDDETRQKKRAYYEEKFSIHPAETKITRFELSIRDGKSCAPSTHLFPTAISQTTFCKQVLRKFAQKKSIRLKPLNWGKTPPKMWDIHPVWSALLFLDCDLDLNEMENLPMINEIRLTSVDDNLTRTIKKLADTAKESGCSLDSLFQRLAKAFNQSNLEAGENEKRHRETVQWLLSRAGCPQEPESEQTIIPILTPPEPKRK